MDGLLVIDKPSGLTSHDVVAGVRRIIGERRVGHTGTLDPFATGVLVVLVGRATRLAQFLSGAEKEYEAVIRLGYATDTGDLMGARVQQQFTTETRRRTEIHREQIEQALESLRGEIEQTPPMFSAKKVAGRKLYDLARRGEEIERKPTVVTVREFQALPGNGPLLQANADGTCNLAVRVVCSAGTYVRTLAESLGERLGVGGHLTALRRTRAGEYKIEDAVTLDQLADRVKTGSLDQIFISSDTALSGMPFLHLSSEEARRARHGAAVQAGGDAAVSWRDGERVRMRDRQGDLIAVGVFDKATRLVRPQVVIS